MPDKLFIPLTRWLISVAIMFAILQACAHNPEKPPVMSSSTAQPSSIDATSLSDQTAWLLAQPALLLEAQIPTLEMYSDEPKTFETARWLKGWGINVESVSAPDNLKAEWIPGARDLKLGERYSYGELLRIWTPDAPGLDAAGNIDLAELNLIKRGEGKVKSLGQLRLTPSPDVPSLVPVTLHLKSKAGDAKAGAITILVRVVTLPRATFTFKPSKPIKSAFVAGSFNGWNKSALPLLDADGDGLYTAMLRVKPGKYDYKFVVDDDWIPDPSNPRQSTDGFHNSVLELEGADAADALEVISVPSPKPDFWAFAVHGGEVDAAMAYAGNESISGEITELQPGVIGLMKQGDAAPRRDIRLTVRSSSGAWSDYMLPRDEQMSSASPAESQHHLIYYAMTDRFHDGNPDNTAPIDDPDLKPLTNFHGGDFAGITQKLREGYFDNLGVTAIWISSPNMNTPKAEFDSLPPHRKFSAYHGYWPVSPTETDPHYGTMDELRAMIAEAKKRGITVIFDFVSNHTHADHPYYREHPEWFGQLDLPDGRKNIRLFDEFPMTTWFDTFLPSYDYPGSPEAIEQVTADAVWWIRETGAGGFRHDATKHVPYDFWMRLSERLWEEIEAPAGQRLFQVGETISDRDLIMSFVGPEMMTGQFDFPLYWSVRQGFAIENIPLSDLAFEMQQSAQAYGKKSRMSPFAGNHDFSRFMAFATGAVTPETNHQEKEIGWSRPPDVTNPSDYEKLRLALAFVLTQPGAPTIYYGDEFGMTGAGDPDNRRPMRFGKDLSHDERANLEFAQKLTRIRHSVSALWRGDTLVLNAEADTMAYLRSDIDSAVLVVLNRSQRPRSLSLALPQALAGSSWHSKLTNHVIESQGTALMLEIPPRGVKILQLRRR